MTPEPTSERPSEFDREPGKPSSEQCRDLLERVVHSKELKRSTRLRELLLYLGQRSLRSPLALIREQEIGAAVFGRPEDYDTNIDNIVRVNVSELRKRLAHYFEQEGAGEPLLIEIPRGGYLPVFLPRAVPDPAPPAPTEPAHPAIPEQSMIDDAGPAAAQLQPTPATLPQSFDPTPAALGSQPNRSALTRVALTAVCLALVAALATAAWLFQQNRRLQIELRPWQTDADTIAFWSQFFASGETVDIVTADSSYALAQDLLQRPISLDDYLDYKYKSFASLPGLTPQTREALNLVLDRNAGSDGDFDAAEHILALDAHSPLLKMASARAYSPQNIKNHNVILIGSSVSNPWVNLYKDRLNFQIEYDAAHHRAFIVNRAPVAGEQRVYQVQPGSDYEYSLVAFLPNLSGSRYVLLIAGTDSLGTQAAGEFITSAAGIGAIRGRLAASRYPYFEVLLTSSRLEGTTLHTSIQAVRGYDH